MKRNLARIAAVVGSLAIMAGLGAVTAAPAQAFTSFTYTANCPGTATYQQLVIQNTSTYQVLAYSSITGLNFGNQFSVGPQWIGYYPIQYNDTMIYKFEGWGDLNWYYHVDCFYN
jgi:hypothetical protein